MSEGDFLSSSGLTDNEAKEFQAAYLQGVFGLSMFAGTAHTLMWFWKPWF